MLKIGDFSKLSRVSIRMLRYYDETGLLKPVKIDAFTGYRYYSEEQLLIMARINSLKAMGFSLASVREMLDCYDDREAMERHLKVCHAELTALAEETNQRIRFLETAIKQLGKENCMSYDVVLKTLPERQVASVRQKIPAYDHEGMLWHVLFQETTPLKMVMAEPPFVSAILHDQEYREEDVDVEVQISVKGNYADTEHVRFKTEPEEQVAGITFKGPYEQFGQVYACLATWVAANGYEFCGPMRDIYYVSPNETQNPEEWITEACCPVRKIR